MLHHSISRRDFVAMTGLATAGLATSWAAGVGAADTRRPRVAALFTELQFRSHAFNILENVLGPYVFNGRKHLPRVDLASLYADQFPEEDMTRDVAKRFGVPLYPTIEAALCLGGDKLAVDAVLLIGEHGDYPFNELGQQLYPRKEFFDRAFAVMQRSGRFVPLFNDKHLSIRWDAARAMYDAARKHGLPMLAGSSVPLAERRPMLELPAGAEIEEAVSIHGGGLESYDFHGLEVLQSFVESRRGGETGVSRVEFLTGDALDRAAGKRWSQELVDAALAAEQRLDGRRQRRPTLGVLTPNKTPAVPNPHRPAGPHAICLTYKSGLRATVLRHGGSSDRWLFACRLRGESAPRATAFFNSPWGNRGLFMALTHAIEHLFVTRQEPYPLERTLLTTGLVEAALRSRHERRPLDTPHLEIAYDAVDFRSFRERGASWQLITADMPQATTIDKHRFDALESAPRP